MILSESDARSFHCLKTTAHSRFGPCSKLQISGWLLLLSAQQVSWSDLLKMIAGSVAMLPALSLFLLLSLVLLLLTLRPEVLARHDAKLFVSKLSILDFRYSVLDANSAYTSTNLKKLGQNLATITWKLQKCFVVNIRKRVDFFLLYFYSWPIPSLGRKFNMLLSKKN